MWLCSAWKWMTDTWASVPWLDRKWQWKTSDFTFERLQSVLFCFLRKQWSCLLNCQSGYQDNFPLFSKVKKTWVCKVANRSLEMRCVVGSDPAVVLTEWIAAAGWRQSGCVLGIFARLMRSKLEVLFMESTFSHLDCKITSRLPMNFSTWPPTQAIFFQSLWFLIPLLLVLLSFYIDCIEKRTASRPKKSNYWGSLLNMDPFQWPPGGTSSFFILFYQCFPQDFIAFVTVVRHV